MTHNISAIGGVRWVMDFFYKGVKFSFSEKATKIYTLVFMVLTFTK